MHISRCLGDFLEQPSLVKNRYFLCKHGKALCQWVESREGARSEMIRQAYVRAQLNSCQWCPLRFYDYVFGYLKIDILLFFLLGKTVSTPSHPWRERPGQSGHYRSSITRCNGHKDTVHMKPAPLLWVDSNSPLVRDPVLCSQHLFLLPSLSLPVSSLAPVALKGGQKGRFSAFQNWLPLLRYERDTYLKASEGAVCEELSSTSLPFTTSFFPSMLTYCHYQHTKHNRFCNKMHLFYSNQTSCVLSGGRGTQSGFSPPNFSRRFLRPLPFKKTIFDIQNIYINIIY